MKLLKDAHISKRKESLLVLISLFGLLFIFYPGVFFAKEAFLTGDHALQHYPWFYLLHQFVSSGKIPFWTDAIHSGFPIAAESQIGIYYLPNLFFAFFFDARHGYSYQLIFHFLLSGFFLYLYLRQMKLQPAAAWTGAVLFVFGGAYGGAYYNITSLKTVAWFPGALYFAERYFESIKKRYILIVAVVLASSLLAGYLQVATFCYLFFSLYVFLRTIFFKEGCTLKKQAVFAGGMILSVLLSAMIAFPQLWITYKLALLSNRAELPEGYAYVGSMSPLAVMTCLFPGIRMIFRANNLYLGIGGLFLISTAMSSSQVRSKAIVKLWLVLWITGLFLALGRWSPLYVGLIKLTGFHSFRIPSKFIVFIVLSASVVAAYGFSVLWPGDRNEKALNPDILRRGRKIFFFILSFLLLLYFLFWLALNVFPDQFYEAARWFVESFIHGQPGHPHNLQNYLDRLRLFQQEIKQLFAITNPRIFVSFLLLVSTVFAVKRLTGSTANGGRELRVFLIVLLIDLYATSYFGVRHDIGKYEKVVPENKITAELIKGVSTGDVRRIFSYKTAGRQIPIRPSTNILLGYSDIGAYSPFIMGRYFETVGQLGNVDDSNGEFSPSVEYVLTRLSILRLLGVTHVVSTVQLSDESLDQIAFDADSGLWLYHLKGGGQEAHFYGRIELMPDWIQLKNAFLDRSPEIDQTLFLESGHYPPLPDDQEGIPTTAVIQLISDNAHAQKWIVETEIPGYFLVPSLDFPGWYAKVDHKDVPIYKGYGLFKTVFLDKPGRHEIEFEYKVLG